MNVIILLLKVLLGFLIFFVFYLIFSYFLTLMTVNPNPKNAKDIAIYIKTNGVHTDIVVPAKNELKDWTKNIKYSDPRNVDSTYLYIGQGWGDKGFYLNTPTWAELKFSVAFKAMFGLSSTAMHSTFYQEMEENKDCVKIWVSKAEYLDLVKFIDNTYKKDKEGKYELIKTDAVYGDTDAFYEAKGRYSFFKTCNSWANKGLKIAGQRACVWTPVQQGIFKKYE